MRYQKAASEDSRKIDTVVMELSDLYCMVPIDYQTCIVYDTYKSFYCIRFKHNKINISKRQEINVKTKWTKEENRCEWNYFTYPRYFLTQNLGGGLVSIFYGTETVEGTAIYNRPRESRPIHLLYQIEKDELIQDLDALINPKE